MGLIHRSMFELQKPCVRNALGLLRVAALRKTSPCRASTGFSFVGLFAASTLVVRQMLGKTLEGFFHSHFFEHILYILELGLL